MKRDYPNWLFIMQAYQEAYAKGRVRRRYHFSSLPVVDGWIPNTFWVDKATAGLNGGARRREIMADYPQFFEVISKNAYVIAYGTSRYLGSANYDFSRIIPSRRKEWKEIVNLKRQEWLKRGVK